MPHNGNTTQLNLWFLGGEGQFTFLNRMKEGAKWNGYLDPSKHDDNGYMHTVYGGGVTCNTILIPTQSQRPGRYFMKSDGTGDLTLPFSYTGGSGTLTGNGCRYEFLPGTTALKVGVTAVGTPGVDYPHNIRIGHVDDEAAIDADPYAFNPALIALASKVGVLRFLDWTNTNLSQWVNFSDRLPLDHYSYASFYMKPDIYYVATNVGDAYSVTTGRGALQDGEQLIVRPSATSSGLTPTLNRDGTGDKDIVFADGRTLFSANQKPQENEIGILTYSSILDCWLKWGGDTEKFAQSINSGVPTEIILKFCKEAGCHPWFNIPHLALDTFKPFTSDFATFVKAWTDANAPWMIPRYEPTNELWNFGNGFMQTRFAWACEAAKGYGSFDDNHWYGRVLTKVGQAISAVYGGDTAKYEVIGGAWVTSTPSVISSARFESSRYVMETGDPANSALNWCTTITPAYYWSPGMILDASESSRADAYVAASAAAKPALVASYLRDEGTQPSTPVKTKTRMLNWQTYADGKSKKHMPYEGGFGSLRVATPSTNIEILRNAGYDSPELYQLTQELHQYFKSIGGLFMSKYVLSGRYELAMFDPDIYATPSQEWNAIVAWNEGKLRYRLTAS